MKKFNLIKPGSKFNKMGISKKSAVISKNISIKFPSRIHITPIDCNRFDFGMPGGGGIGFAIDLTNILSFSFANGLIVKSSNKKYENIIIHFVKLMECIFGTDLKFNIFLELAPIIRQHFGLGSSVCVACGITWGLNKLCGSPLSTEELRTLIAYNFVEEYNNGLTRGLETGVGTSVVFKGGISVVANNIIEILNRKFPNGYSVLLINPKTTRKQMDKPESEEMLNRTFFLDESYRYIKSYNILMDIIPAIYSEDLKKLGNYIWDIQFSGTHLSMIQSYSNYGRKIYDILGTLRGLGAIVCGISSVGPAIYCICKNDETVFFKDSLKSKYHKNISISEASPNNIGIQVIED